MGREPLHLKMFSQQIHDMRRNSELKIGFGRIHSLPRFNLSSSSLAPHFFGGGIVLFFFYDFRSLKKYSKNVLFLGICHWAKTMGRLDAEEFCGAMPSEVRRYSRLERACGRFVDVLVEHINIFDVCLCKFCWYVQTTITQACCVNCICFCMLRTMISWAL